MKAMKVEGATRNLGAPRDWNEQTHGPCDVLPVRDVLVNGTQAMLSKWQLTPEEIVLLGSGMPVYLLIWGERHPPVAICVGEPTLS